MTTSLMCRIVHLDLKSCNVLIGGDGTAKISDVGLAVLIRERYLSMTAPAGTFAWVAPEVILGGAHSAFRDPFRAVVDIQLLLLRHALQRWFRDMQ